MGGRHTLYRIGAASWRNLTRKIYSAVSTFRRVDAWIQRAVPSGGTFRRPRIQNCALALANAFYGSKSVLLQLLLRDRWLGAERVCFYHIRLGQRIIYAEISKNCQERRHWRHQPKLLLNKTFNEPFRRRYWNQTVLSNEHEHRGKFARFLQTKSFQRTSA